nr:MAG TPA: Protein recA [Caudoviricetes sp.]
MAVSLADVLKDMEKISGKGAVMEGVEVKDIYRIPLPMIAINRMLYGGIPRGRMIEFYGPESSGKTTTALLAVAAYQAQDTRPALFVDAEGTYDPRWAKLLGVDNSVGRFIKWAPENVNAEEVFQKILDVVETGEVGMIVLDSIPTLVPMQEDEKDMTQKTMGGISAPLTVFARKLQKALLKNDDVVFIGLNQARENMSQYGPATTTPGGRAWRHMCSVRMEFKSEFADANGVYLPSGAENPAGATIIAALKKNKTSSGDRRSGRYTVDFKKGFNEKMDVFGVALLTGVIEQRGSSFSYINVETGEVIHKAQGKVKFIETMTDDVFEMIKEEVNKNAD